MKNKQKAFPYKTKQNKVTKIKSMEWRVATEESRS